MAFDAVRAVHADGAYANLALARLLDERRLTGRDAAFATELVAGTCRLEGTYDLIIVAAGGRPIRSLQPAVVDLLRLGTHQLLSMRVPVHAAVSATVELAASTVGRRVTGLVNAVLRRVAEHDWDTWAERLTAGLDERSALEVSTAHPRWIVDALAEVLPADELEACLRADNDPAPVTLAVRPGLAEVSELVAAGAQPGRWSPYAATWAGAPRELAAVRDGRAGVQDEGSQLVSLAVARAAAEPGPWLDLCAGPGGKSALLAGLAAARSEQVLSVELAPHRAALVAAARRAYPGPSEVIVADGTAPAWRAEPFSRVLADVPCSGLGALRRRPESRWRRSGTVVEELHPLQVALLTTAIDAVQPGGVVGYVTCSPHRRETTDVVDDALRARPDIEVIDALPLLPELPANAVSGPFLQLWPHRHGTDAMFLALLRRRP